MQAAETNASFGPLFPLLGQSMTRSLAPLCADRQKRNVCSLVMRRPGSVGERDEQGARGVLRCALRGHLLPGLAEPKGVGGRVLCRLYQLAQSGHHCGGQCAGCGGPRLAALVARYPRRLRGRPRLLRLQSRMRSNATASQNRCLPKKTQEERVRRGRTHGWREESIPSPSHRD